MSYNLETSLTEYGASKEILFCHELQRRNQWKANQELSGSRFAQDALSVQDSVACTNLSQMR